MEGLGAAASAIAVIDLAAKVSALCLQYSRDVRNAKHDIEGFRQQTEALKTIAEGAQRLLQGPDGPRLETAQNLHKALANAHSQLDPIHAKLEEKLNTGRTVRAMRRIGLRALTWPFESKDVDKIISNLQRERDAISAALQIDQTNHILSANRQIALSKLPVAKGAAFDAQANEHDPGCYPETRVDLLADIYEWIEDPDGKCIFWLRGMAGTGKSTISRTVAKKLSEAKVPSASFFKKGEGDRSKAAMFFTTIIAQLVLQLPTLAPHVQSAIESDPTIVDKTKKEQFEKLFLEPLSKCRGHNSQRLAVVVDALDECHCEKDITAIIHLLSRAKEAKFFRLRFFVTSRPELPIRLGFKDIGGSYRDLALHEIPHEDIRKDISTFLRAKLDEIRRDFSKVTGTGLPPQWPLPADVKGLVDMAVPLFIFASTACRFIADIRCGNPMEQLDKILEYNTKGGWSQLHMTYLPILNQLLLNHTDTGSARRTEEEEAEIVAWFRNIVGTIVLLADPLPSASLARLLGRSQLDVDSKLCTLHSVLDISENPLAPVKLLHLSFRDFLVKNRDGNPFSVNEREIHEQLADRCLKLLSTGDTLRKDICNLRYPGTLRSQISPLTVNKSLPPEAQYACRYWVYHYNESRRQIRDGDPVHEFLTSRLLYWLEALGIMGLIRESISMVNDLLNLLEPENSSTVSALFRDVQRFILNYCAIIDASPLQVYCSATIFAPKNSVIRKMYYSHFPNWLLLTPRVDLDWNACLQTLEGHSDWVKSVAFSRDGRQLASASNDKTVKLWDVATGACVATLEGHSNLVNSVAFLRDGRQLASASDDKTVKLWDVATGACVATLEGHSSLVNSVAFSRDGRQLASASYDNTVKLWDVATGACHQTVNVGTVVFNISFDAAGSCIYTDVGTILVNKLPTAHATLEASSQPPRSQKVGISSDRTWINWNGQNVLWLPPEYRPTMSTIAGSTVAFGCASGRVLVFRFSGKDSISP